MRFRNLLLLILLSLVSIQSQAQETDSVTFKKGISLGVDVSGLMVNIFDKDQNDIGAWVCYDLSRKYKIMTQVGMGSIAVKNKNIDYKSDGDYALIGIDYNFYKKGKPDNIDMVFIGMRYGIASLQHKTLYYRIEDKNWGNFESNLISSTVKAYWITLTFGIRVEVFKNFQMGWNINYNRLYSTGGNSLVSPILIPGFGKGNSSSNFGFNYGIFYKIPFN